jgi:hypothetical protein
MAALGDIRDELKRNLRPYPLMVQSSYPSGALSEIDQPPV